MGNRQPSASPLRSPSKTIKSVDKKKKIKLKNKIKRQKKSLKWKKNNSMEQNPIFSSNSECTAFFCVQTRARTTTTQLLGRVQRHSSSPPARAAPLPPRVSFAI